MKLLSLPFLIFLVFSSQNVFSDALPEQKLADQLAKLTAHSASFQQTVTEEDGYVLDENNGVMSFERPSKLYWRVLEPFPNLLVSDGEKIYFYDPELDQVTIRKWRSNPSENPVAVFIGETAISDYYSVEETKGRFILTPKNSGSGFSEIQIEFANDAPQSMMISDTLGQITTISFSKMDDRADDAIDGGVESGKIPENPYAFTIPATAEVINDR